MMKKYGVVIGAAALFALTGCVATMPYNQVSSGGAAPGGSALGEEPCCVPAGSSEPCGGPGELPCCPGNDAPVVPPPVVAPHHPPSPPPHNPPHHPPRDCRTCEEVPPGRYQCPPDDPVPQCEQNQPAPPEILPGECYARCLVKGKVITRHKPVVTKCGYKDPFIVEKPAAATETVTVQRGGEWLQCREGEEQIQIHPAYKKCDIIPGKWDRRQIEVSRCNPHAPIWRDIPRTVTFDYEGLEVIEPQFGPGEQCCVPLHKGTKWDKTQCTLQEVQEGIKDCDTLCLEEYMIPNNHGCTDSVVLIKEGGFAVIPKQDVKHYTERVLQQPPPNPCESATDWIEVMVQPPQVSCVDVPPKYQTVRKCIPEPIHIPDETEDIVFHYTAQEGDYEFVPPEYKCVQERVQVCEPVMIWKKVLCEDDRTSQRMRDIQMNLNRAGYNVPLDGTYGPATRQAVKEYQRDRGLPIAVGGDLTMETLESLGVY